MPCTPEAADVLRKANVIIPPWMAAGTGGVVSGEYELKETNVNWSPEYFESKLQSSASTKIKKLQAQEKRRNECFASIFSSSGKETSSIAVNPQPPMPPPPSQVGSPLFWIGVGVGFSALFSWVARRMKKYAMQQAFKTMMGHMDAQNNKFNNQFNSPSLIKVCHLLEKFHPGDSEFFTNSLCLAWEDHFGNLYFPVPHLAEIKYASVFLPL